MTRVFGAAVLALSCGGQAKSLISSGSSGGAGSLGGRAPNQSGGSRAGGTTGDTGGASAGANAGGASAGANTGGASAGAVSISGGGSSAAGAAGSPNLRHELYGLAHDSDRIVAVGTQLNLDDPNFSSTGVIFVSKDGLDWQPVLQGTKELFWDVAYGNGHFVAVSNAGPYVSEDGETWQPSKLRDTGLAQRLAFGNGMFVTSGSNRYYRSENGVDWTTFGPNLGYGDVYFANGQFLSTRWVFRGDEPAGGEFLDAQFPDTPIYMPNTFSVVNDRFRAVFVNDCCYGEQPQKVRYGTGSSANGLDWDIETWDVIPEPPTILLETASVCLGRPVVGPFLAGPDCSSLEPIEDKLFMPSSTLYLNDLYIVSGVPGILTSTDGVTWDRALWSKYGIAGEP